MIILRTRLLETRRFFTPRNKFSGNSRSFPKVFAIIIEAPNSQQRLRRVFTQKSHKPLKRRKVLPPNRMNLLRGNNKHLKLFLLCLIFLASSRMSTKDIIFIWRIQICLKFYVKKLKFWLLQSTQTMNKVVVSHKISCFLNNAAATEIKKVVRSRQCKTSISHLIMINQDIIMIMLPLLRLINLMLNFSW